MNNSKHANNKTNDALVLGQDLIQKIDDITIYAEKIYSPIFTIANKTFCLSLHYKDDDSKEVIVFKAKNQRVLGKYLS